MNFQELKTLVLSYTGKDFQETSDFFESQFKDISKEDFLDLLLQIGIIPEDIDPDSSEEKLYAKVSDIIFAKSLEFLNLKTKVLAERGNSADIFAQSKYHGYSLVGDAKIFRLSRTAKNAKDFKVDSMVVWKGDNDYSVLACPYYQYPSKRSQIYKKALHGNVSLFSWELLYFLIKNNVKETQSRNLSYLWNQSAEIAKITSVDNSENCFLERQNQNLLKFLGIRREIFDQDLKFAEETIISRSKNEIRFYKNEIERIKNLSHDEAVEELLNSLKLESKIQTINKFIKFLK